MPASNRRLTDIQGKAKVGIFNYFSFLSVLSHLELGLKRNRGRPNPTLFSILSIRRKYNLGSVRMIWSFAKLRGIIVPRNTGLYRI